MKTMMVLGGVGFVLAMVGCGSADSSVDPSSEDEIKSATVLTCTPVDADEACLETGTASDYCVDQITVTVSSVNKAKLRIDRSRNFDESTAPPPGAVGLPLPVPHNGPPPGTMGMPVAPHNGPPPGTMGLPLPGPSPITATGSLRFEGRNVDGSWHGGDITLDAQKSGRGYVGSFVAAKDLSFAISCTVKGSNGPPPGTVGLPLPPVEADAGHHNGPPPGAVGLPILTSCPTQKVINCQPPTTNPNCVPAKRQAIEKSCSDVSFLD